LLCRRSGCLRSPAIAVLRLSEKLEAADHVRARVTRSGMGIVRRIFECFTLSPWERAARFELSALSLTLSQRERQRWMRALKLLVVLAFVRGPSALCAQATTPPAEPPKNVVEPLPEPAPAWPAGYQLRYTLRVVGDVAQSQSKAIVARLPTGSWLRPDGADIAVQAADGTLLPVAVLSHAATGETLIQFPRHANDVWYWAAAVNPAAPAAAAQPLPEGIVMEVRDWAGGDLSSWNAVREGLTKSTPILANAFVAEIMQNCN